MVEKWSMAGAIYGSCNCDWGCPCSFDAPPTYGHCDGVYVFTLREGRYGDVSLDGLNFAWGAHSPGAVPEGQATAALIVDERASAEQRQALETLWRGGGVGLPFDILSAVTETWLDTQYAPFDVVLAGINTRAKIGQGGEIYELAQSRIRNPVTDEEEELYLDKPMGFTAKRAELGMSQVARFAADGLAFDTSGKYAEYAEFEYAGP